MFLVLLIAITVVQATVKIEFVQTNQDGDFKLFVYVKNGVYRVYTSMNNNYSYYDYPIEQEFRLTYDGNYTINNHSVNLINSRGVVTPPAQVLSMFVDKMSINTEVLQLCYDFTTERISLKIAIGVLALIFLVSHGPKSRRYVETFVRDLLRPEFARRFSRDRSPVARSEVAYSPAPKEARCWFSESPETLHQTSTVQRCEEVSQGVGS